MELIYDDRLPCSSYVIKDMEGLISLGVMLEGNHATELYVKNDFDNEVYEVLETYFNIEYVRTVRLKFVEHDDICEYRKYKNEFDRGINYNRLWHLRREDED